ERAENSGRAAHVEFHLVHFRRRLERDAAGVERDALAAEDDGPLILRTAGVAQDDQPGRLLGAARDRQECAHAELLDLPLVQDLDAELLMALRERLRRLGEMRRRAYVWRTIAEVAGELHAVRDRRAVCDAAPCVA